MEKKIFRNKSDTVELKLSIDEDFIGLYKLYFEEHLFLYTTLDILVSQSVVKSLKILEILESAPRFSLVSFFLQESP